MGRLVLGAAAWSQHIHELREREEGARTAAQTSGATPGYRKGGEKRLQASRRQTLLEVT